MNKKYSIVDRALLNYYVPSSSKGMTRTCPECGKLRTLTCFNLQSEDGSIQYISEDYSMCANIYCPSHAVHVYPRNEQLEALLRDADERDGIPASETEEKLKVLRKHYKDKKGSQMASNDPQIKHTDWEEESRIAKIKYEQSCIFNKGMEQYFHQYEFVDSELGRYLSRLFGRGGVDYVAREIYRLWTADPSDGYTQFAYHDYLGNLRNIKDIPYLEDGHRNHRLQIRQGGHYKGIINRMLDNKVRFYADGTRKISQQPLTQKYFEKECPRFNNDCALFLFGEHLLKTHKGADVYIVESEKTALIMQIYCYVNRIPAICLATGSLSYFKPQMFACLKGRNVVFFPDNDKGIEYWQDKVDSFGNDWFASKRISNWYADFEAKDKEDLADVIIRQQLEWRQLQEKRNEFTLKDIMFHPQKYESK